MAIGSASETMASGAVRAVPRRRLSWFAQARAVLSKDLTIELSTGEVVITSGFFALLVVIMASLAFFGGPASGRIVASGVIWLSLAFAAVLAFGQDLATRARRVGAGRAVGRAAGA